ncbi:spore coat putative kinase YutH [Bacillus tuaregi]|uniref:spore coat putative kinase YutH n=1 Tax=Bacillus tuaregi TaxID=1816695 RepID=UPI0008F8C306|nr:spore coat protein YutH [Bacillus tuaregi]
MLQKLLKQYYGIEASEAMPIGHYHSCKKENQRFILIPVNHATEEELAELEQIANHLKNNGDRSVSTFLYTKENHRVLALESDKYCVLVIRESPSRIGQMGRKLAKFHYRGRSISFPVQKITRIGQWKSLWEMRIDQMEKVWSSMLYQPPENEFDRMFMESFPYYMAIGENAIQYLVDTELDDDPKTIDNGTVCHIRFTTQTWGDSNLRNPFDWVFDHCSRDLAEWTRECYFHHYRTYQPEIQSFYKDYQSIEPLSSFAWRLLYARLIFPLHYMECIEDYYSTSSEQQQRLLTERLESYLQHSGDHEKFLQDFYPLVEAPVHKFQIPVMDWL